MLKNNTFFTVCEPMKGKNFECVYTLSSLSLCFYFMVDPLCDWFRFKYVCYFHWFKSEKESLSQCFLKVLESEIYNCKISFIFNKNNPQMLNDFKNWSH